MVTSRGIIGVLLLLCAAAGAREAASPLSCQSAAGQPAIVTSKAALDRNPANLAARFNLADAWSDAGCFSEAVQILQNAPDPQSRNQELQTRLRVAKSLVGEEMYFEKLDRADAEAKLKRDAFRCSTLSDLDACGEAARIKPDDAASLAPSQPGRATKLSAAEAQVRAVQPSVVTPSGPAVARIRRTPEVPLRVTHAHADDTTGHQYSNAEPPASSH